MRTAFIIVLMTIVNGITGVSTLYIILSFIDALMVVGRGGNWGV